MKIPQINQHKLLFVFDVDGTLTPSRQPMTSEFSDWFREYFKEQPYAFVSGSDYSKLQEQIPEDILVKARAVFACSGNNIWVNGIEVHKETWTPPAELIAKLEKELAWNTYRIKTGNHIEIRTGLVNFSFIGRNCTIEQRKAYAEWDKEHSERLWLALQIRQTFPNLMAEIGGEISIDIYPKGKNKSQILKWLDKSIIYFFGDGMEPGKNDWPLATSLRFPSKAFPVVNHEDTKNQINSLTLD